MSVILFLCGCTTGREAAVDNRPPLDEFFANQMADRTARLKPYQYTEEQLGLPEAMSLPTKEADKLRKSGQLALAKQKYKEILARYESKLSSSDPLLCRMLNRLVECSRELKDWKDEEKFAVRLLAIRDKWLGKSSADSASAAARLAEALREQDKLTEASRIVDERLNISPEPGIDNEYTAPVGEAILLFEKSQIALATGNSEEATRLTERVQKLRQAFGPEMKKVELVHDFDGQKR